MPEQRDFSGELFPLPLQVGSGLLFTFLRTADFRPPAPERPARGGEMIALAGFHAALLSPHPFPFRRCHPPILRRNLILLRINEEARFLKGAFFSQAIHIFFSSKKNVNRLKKIPAPLESGLARFRHADFSRNGRTRAKANLIFSFPHEAGTKVFN